MHSVFNQSEHAVTASAQVAFVFHVCVCNAVDLLYNRIISRNRREGVTFYLSWDLSYTDDLGRIEEWIVGGQTPRA